MVYLDFALVLTVLSLFSIIVMGLRVAQYRSMGRELIKSLEDVLYEGAHHQLEWPDLPERSSALTELRLRVQSAVVALREEREKTVQEQSKLSGILGHILSGVMMLDRAGRIVFVNPAMETLFGLPAENWIGRWHWETAYPYEVAALVDESLSLGTTQKREVTVHKPHDLTLEVHVTPILHSTGGVAGAVLLLHDVTEWRRLESMRSDFVANVSHELRTPITALKGFAETLLDGALDDPKVAREFLEIIRAEADRITRLVNDLLDLSKIEAKQVPLHMEDVSLREMFARVTQVFIADAKQEGVTIQSELPVPDVRVYADIDRLQQVLVNLVSNALQFTPRGGQITLSAEAVHDRMVVRVRDTGAGIPAQDLGRVFERFYRVDKARSRRSGGTGLGLAIVKHIVEAHGGRVGVSSEFGQGSEFFFDLPTSQETTPL